VPYTNALERLGRFDEVQKYRHLEMNILERQLETVPEDVRARVLLAADYANLGRAEDAIRQAEMASALRPNDSSVPLQRGVYVRSAGKENRIDCRLASRKRSGLFKQ